MSRVLELERMRLVRGQLDLLRRQLLRSVFDELLAMVDVSGKLHELEQRWRVESMADGSVSIGGGLRRLRDAHKLRLLSRHCHVPIRHLRKADDGLVHELGDDGRTMHERHDGRDAR